MNGLTRRDFLKLGAKFSLLLGIGSSGIPKIAEALEEIATGKSPVLWLHGQSCSGCSISFLNLENPEAEDILINYISLLFHSVLSASSGELSMELIDNAIKKGRYTLVLEGSIPKNMPEACTIGGISFEELFKKAATNASYILAVGTCACFGGIPGAEGNPTGAVGILEFLKQKNIQTKTILIPGCPTHPDWVMGTLIYILKFGMPPLDEKLRPKMFFSKYVHLQCPYYSNYEEERFARNLSDKGCLFKLGCLGPISHGDCPLRLWNSGTSFCIKAHAPCIGCTSEDFSKRKNFPFYRKSESVL